MKRIASYLTLVCIVVIGVAGSLRADDKKSKIEGTWKVESAKKEGEDFERPVGDMVTFSGDQMTVKKKNGDEEKGITVKLDTSPSPSQIDFSISRNGEAVTVHGVFEVKADTLRLCMAMPGSDRPESLESGSDSSQMSLVLKRVKEE